MAFVPSQYSYGADEAASAPAAPKSAIEQGLAYLTAASPAINVAEALVGKSDQEKLAILRAKVRNYRRTMTQLPYSLIPGKLWYQNEIAKMNAQIRALGGEVRKDESVSTDYSILRKVTIVGAISGIVLVGALTVRALRK